MPASPSEPSSDALVSALGGSLDTGSVVSEVAKRLLAYFTSGELPAGARLPAERQLAASLGVGRSAVREALAALDMLGIVQVRPSSGTYLRGSVSELLPQTLGWGLMLGERDTEDLLELRHGLEVQAARLAAERASAEQITAIRACLEQMADHLDRLEEFVEADLFFHRAVAAASGNAILGDLLNSVRSLLRVWTERALRDAAEAKIVLSQHAAVLAAIEGNDPSAAAATMSAHMDGAGERLLQAFAAEQAAKGKSGDPFPRARSRAGPLIACAQPVDQSWCRS